MEAGHQMDAICDDCDRQVVARLEYRTVRLSESGVEVHNVLVGVCTECDEVVLLPGQSVPRIRETRDRLNRENATALTPRPASEGPDDDGLALLEAQEDAAKVSREHFSRRRCPGTPTTMHDESLTVQRVESIFEALDMLIQ